MVGTWVLEKKLGKRFQRMREFTLYIYLGSQGKGMGLGTPSMTALYILLSTLNPEYQHTNEEKIVPTYI